MAGGAPFPLELEECIGRHCSCNKKGKEQTGVAVGQKGGGGLFGRAKEGAAVHACRQHRTRSTLHELGENSKALHAAHGDT